jgi:hypothetical protein
MKYAGNLWVPVSPQAGDFFISAFSFQLVQINLFNWPIQFNLLISIGFFDFLPKILATKIQLIHAFGDIRE